MFEQFTRNFKEKLQSGSGASEPGQPKPISAVGLAFSALKASVKGKSSASEGKPEKSPAQDSGKKG